MNGLEGYFHVKGATGILTPGAVGGATATCPPSSPRMVAGGFESNVTTVTDAYPLGEGSWRGYARNDGPGNIKVNARVVCTT